MLTYWLIGLIALFYTLGSSYPLVAGNLLAEQLRKQYGPFSRLDVKVLTAPPIRALGGQVDSLDVRAEGFAIQGIPIATASLVTAPFLIPSQAWWSPPKMPSSLEGTASAVFSEEGLNTVLHAANVTTRLQGLKIQFSLLPGFSTTRTLNISPGRLRVLSNQLTVEGMADLGDGAVFPFFVSATPQLIGPNRVGFVDLKATFAGAEIPPSYLGNALQQAQVDLSTFSSPGKTFNLARMTLAPGALSLEASLKITDFR